MMIIQRTVSAATKSGSATAKHLPKTAERDANLQAVLLREGNHRLANSLQLATSVLSLRARDAKSPEARDILLEVSREIGIIGKMHRKLCEVDNPEIIDMDAYLTELCFDISASIIGSGGATFTFKSRSDKPVYFEAGRAAQVGLIITELMTNCAKHAGPKPECKVMSNMTDNALELTITDNGPGLSKDFELEGRNGIGIHILKSLVSGMKGTLVFVPSVSGAHFVISLPLRALDSL